MNTKFLMISSALVMGIVGIALNFFPAEIGSSLGLGSSGMHVLMLQILGALYFAFAMLNWMAKANLIGGIYSRPVAIANVTHFLIGALTFVKAAVSFNSQLLWIPAVLYSLFAVAFIYVLYTHPVKANSTVPN